VGRTPVGSNAVKTNIIVACSTSAMQLFNLVGIMTDCLKNHDIIAK